MSGLFEKYIFEQAQDIYQCDLLAIQALTDQQQTDLKCACMYLRYLMGTQALERDIRNGCRLHLKLTQQEVAFRLPKSQLILDTQTLKTPHSSAATVLKALSMYDNSLVYYMPILFDLETELFLLEGTYVENQRSLP